MTQLCILLAFCAVLPKCFKARFFNDETTTHWSPAHVFPVYWYANRPELKSGFFRETKKASDLNWLSMNRWRSTTKPLLIAKGHNYRCFWHIHHRLNERLWSHRCKYKARRKQCSDAHHCGLKASKAVHILRKEIATKTERPREIILTNRACCGSLSHIDLNFFPLERLTIILFDIFFVAERMQFCSFNSADSATKPISALIRLMHQWRFLGSQCRETGRLRRGSKGGGGALILYIYSAKALRNVYWAFSAVKLGGPSIIAGANTPEGRHSSRMEVTSPCKKYCS